MASEPKTIKFQLMLSESEAKAIDDWGFDNRIRTRAEAIRRLCQMGLSLDENVTDLFAQAKAATHLYRDRREEVAMLLSEPPKSAEEIASASARILPELMLQLKELSLVSGQVALAALPYTIAPEFEDAQQLSGLLQEVSKLASKTAK